VASGAITETNSGTISTNTGTIAGDTTSIDGKITACNTGAVVVASGAITETNSGTISTNTGTIAGDTTSIDGKITACNTGAIAGSVSITNADTEFSEIVFSGAVTSGNNQECTFTQGTNRQVKSLTVVCSNLAGLAYNAKLDLYRDGTTTKFGELPVNVVFDDYTQCNALTNKSFTVTPNFNDTIMIYARYKYT
jgi:hypothetical protein